MRPMALQGLMIRLLSMSYNLLDVLVAVLVLWQSIKSVKYFYDIFLTDLAPTG